MLIYLCATATALAECLAQLPEQGRLGILTAGDVPPLEQPPTNAAAFPIHGSLGSEDRAALHACTAVYVDLGPGAGVDDLVVLRAALFELAQTQLILVAGPNAMALLGQVQGDAPDHALVPHTLIVPVLQHAPDVAWLMQPDAPRRLLAFDGDVFVGYDSQAAAVTVHGDGSVLAIVLEEGDRRIEGAHAGVLTPGMRLSW